MANFRLPYSDFRKQIVVLFCLFILFITFSYCTKQVESLTAGDQQKVDDYTNAVKNGLFERKPDSLQKLALQVIGISDKIEDKKTIIQAFNLCAATYNIFGYPDSAIFYATKMKALATKTKDHVNLARAYNILSIANQKKHNYEEAKTNLQEAILITKINGEGKEIGSYYLSIGRIFNENRVYDSAIFYNQLAAENFETYNIKKGIAKACGNIGAIHINLNNFDEALNYYQKALDINKEIQNYASLSHSYNSMGVLFKELKKYDTAIIYYDSAMKLHESMGNIPMMIATKFNEANALKKMGQPEKAIERYFETLKLSNEIQLDRGIMKSKIAIGNTYLDVGEYQKANQYFTEALQLANDNSIIENLDGILLGITHAAIGLNNSEKATESLLQHQIIVDSLNFKNQQKLVADLEARYQLQKKNNEIKDMIMLNQSKTWLNYLLMIILVLVSIFGIVIFRLYKKLQFNYRILYDKELAENHTAFPLNGEKVINKEYEVDTPSEWEDIWNKIQLCLLEDEIFLEPKLNIEMLANKCDSNKTYIYQCIKYYTPDNFNAFINKYRVEKAKKLILERTDYDIKSIGELSGFNSSSTFFRAFKEITGLSPSTFKSLSNKGSNNESHHLFLF